jgi:hypothetical protein
MTCSKTGTVFDIMSSTDIPSGFEPDLSSFTVARDPMDRTDRADVVLTGKVGVGADVHFLVRSIAQNEAMGPFIDRVIGTVGSYSLFSAYRSGSLVAVEAMFNELQFVEFNLDSNGFVFAGTTTVLGSFACTTGVRNAAVAWPQGSTAYAVTCQNGASNELYVSPDVGTQPVLVTSGAPDDRSLWVDGMTIADGVHLIETDDAYFRHGTDEVALQAFTQMTFGGLADSSHAFKVLPQFDETASSVIGSSLLLVNLMQNGGLQAFFGSLTPPEYGQLTGDWAPESFSTVYDGPPSGVSVLADPGMNIDRVDVCGASLLADANGDKTAALTIISRQGQLLLFNDPIVTGKIEVAAAAPIGLVDLVAWLEPSGSGWVVRGQYLTCTTR